MIRCAIPGAESSLGQPRAVKSGIPLYPPRPPTRPSRQSRPRPGLLDRSGGGSMTWWDRPSGTCRPAPVGVGRRPARWCAGAGDGMGHLHHGGSWSNPRVRARRSAPRLGGGGGPRRRFLRRTARQIMPVPRRRRRRGRAAHQWPPGPGPEVSTRGQSTRWMRASPNRSVRWARAEFGAVIYRAVSQVCKERCRRWGQERACRAHLSELARAVRSDRTGAFSPSPLTPHRVGRWEVDRMAAGGRPSLVDSSWSRDASRSCPDGGWKSMQAGEGEDAGRPGRTTWAHRCSAWRRPRRPVRHNDRLRSGLEGPGR